MATLYSNVKSGQISDAPLTSGATTINSAAFANLPTVSGSDILWITLDPDGVDGAPEIVKVTAHTAAATSVTVVRAQQSTVAREHAVSTVWTHAVTKTDLDSFLTTTDVDEDILTLALPANTTISTFGASLLDDADAAAGRTTLGAVQAVSTITKINGPITQATYDGLTPDADTLYVIVG